MFSRFISNKDNDSNSYSSLLEDMASQNIESLILIPSRREVHAKYKDGQSKIIPIFPNDQTVLETAESNGIVLEVRDGRAEETFASFTASFTLGFIFILLCIILIKKSAKLANKSISFLSGKASFEDTINIVTRFDDIAGIPEALEEVKEIVSFLKIPDKYNNLGASIPKGFLLTGPPGTGKTLLAKALAGEAGVPFISTSASQFVELFVGIGASRVSSLFAQAKRKSPSIIFIDEIDSIGRKRGSGIGGGNDEREQTLNQLLIEMDGFPQNSGVIVIAATNREEVLDPALIRPGRFDRRINVSLPDRKGREDILSIHALSKPLCDNVILKEWAIRTPGFSGADLSNFLNEAAIITARENKKRIGEKQLEKSLDRITLGLRDYPLKSLNQLRIIAYHEIGKALVAYLTPSADSVDKITILRRSGSLTGNTRFTNLTQNSEDGYFSKRYLENKLMVSLGGRAAEELIFGKSEITQISSNQLDEATLLANKMVTKYGFSDLGPISIVIDKLAKGFESSLLGSKSIYANRTNKQIDSLITTLIRDSQEKAKQKITPYLNVLDIMAASLLEEEVFTKERFETLFKTATNSYTD